MEWDDLLAEPRKKGAKEPPMSAAKRQRLALRELDKAKKVYTWSKRAFITCAGVVLVALLTLVFLWMWGYQGKYVHHDRGDVVFGFTLLTLVIGGGALCLGGYVWNYYLEDAYHRRERAQEAWEDAMADD